MSWENVYSATAAAIVVACVYTVVDRPAEPSLVQPERSACAERWRGHADEVRAACRGYGVRAL